MRSIGIDLEPHVQTGLLQFRASRPTTQGLEMHLAMMSKAIRDIQPHAVVVDPITDFTAVGTHQAIKSMLMRLIDELKSKQITSLFTTLIHGNFTTEITDVGVSSLMDTWLSLRDMEVNGERNRVLELVKSRGMPHSNQVREFLITHRGIDLMDVYLGTEGVLTGSARLAQVGKEAATTILLERAAGRKRQELERKRQLVEAQIAVLRAGVESDEENERHAITVEQDRLGQLTRDRAEMATSRQADTQCPNGEKDE